MRNCKEISRQRLTVALAYIATALLTLIPFFQVGFTTGDDLLYFQTTRFGWDYWMGDARLYAENQGRFYFLVTKIFYYIPYLVDSFVYTKVVQYVTLMASYAMVAYFVYRLFHSWRLGLMVLLLVILDTAITANNHIATIAYPFYFSFSLIVFVGALLLFMGYRERGGSWRLMLSALLMLFAFLFYEMYLLFAILFLVIVVIGYWCERHFMGMLRSRDFWCEIMPYIVAVVIYVGFYFGYRQWLMAADPTREFYGGATFTAGAFSLEGFFKVLWRCTRGVFPWQYYLDAKSLMQDNSPLIAGHSNSLWRVLTHTPAVVWITALLQAALLWWLTSGEGQEKLSWRKIGVGLATALFLAFFAHTLIGITPKYNQEWSQWMRGYVTSYFSMFALMLVFALLIVATLQLCKRPRVRQLWRGAWCVFIMLLSLLTGYSNHHVGREWAKSQHRFTVIDLMAQEDAFAALPDEAAIYIEELQNTSWVAYDISKGSAMGKYINMRTGRSFDYINSVEEFKLQPSDKPLYYLHVAETQKAGELLVALSQVQSGKSRELDSLTTSQVVAYYYSPSKNYTLFYEAAGIWKAIPFAADSHRDRLTKINIQDSAINPRGILVSNMILPWAAQEE